MTAVEVRKRVKHEIRDLIREHQRLPGSILRAMLQRFYDKRKNKVDVLLEGREAADPPGNGRFAQSSSSSSEDEYDAVNIDVAPDNNELTTMVELAPSEQISDTSSCRPQPQVETRDL
jgi:hypothetical protein